jgi:phospholipase A1
MVRVGHPKGTSRGNDRDTLIIKEDILVITRKCIIAVFFITGILIFTSLALAFDNRLSNGFYAETAQNEENDPQPAKPFETDKNQHNQTYDDLFSLYQPYLENISAYEPIYFLVGADPSESRFQFSFKYKFLNPGLSIVKKHHWIQGFHLAYTQTSFWDLKSSSQPFKDTSYKPELFFLTPNLLKKKFGIGSVFFQAGYQHESNGREGDFSRRTNYLYWKPVFIFFNDKNELGLLIAPKFWTYVGNDNDNNPDLNEYRGYFDLELKVGMAKRFVLESHFRHAKKGSSVRLDLTYPLNNLFENIDLYFQVQYVNALAESLIDYRQRTRAVRLGFSIVR